MQLSEHFNLKEFTRSITAQQQGIDNTPSTECIENLKRLCTEVLEPTRTRFNAPITITSGYRSPALNEAVVGEPKSQHMMGEAADFYCHSVTPMYGIWVWMRAYLPRYDQLIYETDADSGKVWIHVSLRKDGNRKQAFIINKNNK